MFSAQFGLILRKANILLDHEIFIKKFLKKRCSLQFINH